MNFASDNNVGASAAILAAMVTANEGSVPSYGADALSRRAEAALAEWFEHEVAVFFVGTGTAANALALGALSPPWGAVLCHAHAHLVGDECGAPEFFTGGAKLLGVGGRDGKIAPDALRAALAALPADVARQSRPACLSLSQATEAGTVYAPADIADLATIAHGRNLAVHMDGARFTNALATLRCTPADLTWRAGVDVLSLGASKNGALACEAIVFFDPARADGFAHQRKRGGHTWSKSRFLAAQMLAWLDDEHWRVLATHANAQAQRLAQGLATLPGFRLAFPCQANEVFLILPRTAAEGLRAAGASFYDWNQAVLDAQNALAKGEVLVRLVASFATDPADVDRFLALARTEAAVP